MCELPTSMKIRVLETLEAIEAWSNSTGLTMFKHGGRTFEFQEEWGICSLVALNDPEFITDSWRMTVKRYLFEIFRRWPSFSGDEWYPVPAPKGYVSYRADAAEDSYENGILDKWRGEYGDNRKDLLKFLIQEIRKDLL